MAVSGEPEELASRLDRLAARLEIVEGRLESLERGSGGVPGAMPDDTEAAPFVPRVPAENLAFAGRTLLVLAGAFVFRSLTASGFLPVAAGVALGLAYALFWLVLADRAAGRSRLASAISHALAASAIAYPLLWENAAKFGVLTPWTAAAGIAGFAGVSLAVAWRRDVRALAWIATAGTIAASFAFVVSGRGLAPPAAVLLVLGAATLWAGHVKGWHGAAVVTALAANGTIALMTLVLLVGRSPRAQELVPPTLLVSLQIALALLYLGSPVVRALRSRAETTIGEIALALPAAVVGVGGAILAEQAAGHGRKSIGAVAALLAAGCYAASFVSLDRREGRRTGFIFYTSAALVLSLTAFSMLLTGPAMALACGAAAAGTTWIGSRRQRATVSLHASVFLAAGAFTSGLASLAARALVRTSPPAAGEITLPMLAVVAVAVFFAALPVASHGRTWGRLSSFPKLLVVAMLAFSACGLTVAAGSGWLTSAAQGTVHAAGLAVFRTATLAVAAVLLAAVSRSQAVREAGWLVYPVLLAGAVKLLAEDLRVGSPAALVASFVLLGGALIVAPQLGRRKTES